MRESAKVTIGVLAFLVVYILIAFFAGELGQQLTSLMLLNGFQSAALFILLALGLSLIFGTMGVINFAHGSFYAVGAYTAFIFSSPAYLDQSFIVAVAGAIVVTGLLGLIVEVGGLRMIYDKSVLVQVLLTFAIALALEGLLLQIFGSTGRSMAVPGWATGTTDLGFVNYPTYRLAVIVMTVLLVVGVWLMLEKTNIGLVIRAGTRNPDMVEALGIDIRRLFTLVFVFGSALAGIAGALAAPIVTLRPFMGLEILIETFVVIVIGGLGSFIGMILGGLIVGMSLIFSDFIPVVQDYGPTIIFVLMAAILLVRPRGLLGEVGMYEE